jgi:RNA polymerase sigma-B factor
MTRGRGEPGIDARGDVAHEGDLEPPGTVAPDVRRRSAELFDRLRAHEGSARDDHARRRVVRDELVHLHLPLVEHCARRFRNRGEPLEDLVQVGTIGLLKAIDRFETGRAVEFSTYATPTIVGEIKRHFRDKGWAIRVPRRLQELRHRIGVATEELSQELGRSPTARELATHLGCSVEEVVEGLDLGNAYATLRLDTGDDADEGTPGLLASLGIEDANLEHVEVRESIKPLLEGLGAREKRILLLRFFRNHTQAQIAEEIGVSQMHVSRLLSRTLLELRLALEAD